MDFNQYLELIEKRLSHNFNIQRNAEVMKEELPLFGKMEIHNEKYFASKNVKVWRAENYEYVMLKEGKNVDEEAILSFQNFLKEAMDSYVRPHSEHMSTTITGVLIVERFPEHLETLVTRFKHRKTFALTLKGWAEIRFIIVDTYSNKVISNKKGKEVADFYLPVKPEQKKKTALPFIK